MRQWINLFAQECLQEAKIISSRPHKNAEYEKFYINPMLSEVDQMLRTRDLRGLTDGTNIFVWDASQLIHSQASHAIAIAGEWKGKLHPPLYKGEVPVPSYDPFRDAFYLYYEGRSQPDGEWVCSPRERRDLGLRSYAITEKSRLVINYPAGVHLMGVTPFARLLRKATVEE